MLLETLLLALVANPLLVNAVSEYWVSISSSSTPYPGSIVTHVGSEVGAHLICGWNGGSNRLRSGRDGGGKTCKVPYNGKEQLTGPPFQVLAYEFLADEMIWKYNPSANDYFDKGVRLNTANEYICAHDARSIGTWAGERCYVTYGGNEYSYTGASTAALQVFPANEYYLSQVDYDFDTATEGGAVPVFGQFVYHSNSQSNPSVVVLSPEVKITQSSKWDISSSLQANTKLRVRAGIPVFASAKWTLSAELDFNGEYESEITDEELFSVSVSIVVPPGQRCGIRMLGFTNSVRLTYTGQVDSTFPSGTSRKSEKTSTYNGISGLGAESEAPTCTPLDPLADQTPIVPEYQILG